MGQDAPTPTNYPAPLFTQGEHSWLSTVRACRVLAPACLALAASQLIL